MTNRCEICSVDHDLGPLNLNGRGKRILVSAFPKSGTNYLIQFLGSNTGHIRISHDLLYMGMGIGPRTDGSAAGTGMTIKEMADQLEGFSGKGFGHIPFNYSFLEAVQARPTTMFVLIRDPKDVIASHYYYVKSKPDVAMNYRFLDDGKLLSEKDDLVLELIRLSVPRWKTFIPWIANGAHPIRFEDIRANESAACQRIIDLVGDEHKAMALNDPRTMIARVNAQRSPTFRRGQVGDWEQVFEPHHIEVYKDVGMLEIERELGYGS